MNNELTEEERSDLRCGACVFRCPPYDKNPQSQRIADTMERLAASPSSKSTKEAEPEFAPTPRRVAAFLRGAGLASHVADNASDEICRWFASSCIKEDGGGGEHA